MYASIRRYEGAGRIDQVIELVDQGFLPIIRQVPGFVAYYAMDVRYGAAVTVSIFENRAGAVEADRLADRWVKENLSSVFPKSFEVTSGEIVVYETATQN